MVHSFLTIETPVVDVLYKEKGSKFIGYLYPIKSEIDVKELLTQIKKEHHAARHWCYAYRLGNEGELFRVNDDGEPSSTAGQPILGQLLSYNVTNVLLVVVRYFGGVKLGVGGLIKAYRETAASTLQEASVINQKVVKFIVVQAAYVHLDKLMKIIKDFSLVILQQEMSFECKITLEVSLEKFEQVISAIENKRLFEYQVS